MERVRAKMRCDSKVERHDGGKPIFEVEFHPVSDADGENAKFYHYTPGGVLKLATINKSAADQFSPGNEYYVDISPA